MGRHLCVSVCVFGLWRGPQTKQGISSHRHRSSSARSLYAKLLFSFAPSCFDNNWHDNIEGLSARVYVPFIKTYFRCNPSRLSVRARLQVQQRLEQGSRLRRRSIPTPPNPKGGNHEGDGGRDQRNGARRNRCVLMHKRVHKLRLCLCAVLMHAAKECGERSKLLR